MSISDTDKERKAMSKHTKGKWTYAAGDGGFPSVMIGTSQPEIVVNAGGGPMDEHEANARLIAAAPELLEAAIDIIRRVDLDHTEPVEFARCAFDDLRAAIASATGN